VHAVRRYECAHCWRRSLIRQSSAAGKEVLHLMVTSSASGSDSERRNVPHSVISYMQLLLHMRQG